MLADGRVDEDDGAGAYFSRLSLLLTAFRSCMKQGAMKTVYSRLIDTNKLSKAPHPQ